MKTTYCHELSCALMGGLNGFDPVTDLKDSHYTSDGYEVVIEWNGQFYCIHVQPEEKPHD